MLEYFGFHSFTRFLDHLPSSFFLLILPPWSFLFQFFQLLDGEIRVCWLVTGQIQILQESEVLVVDRMFDYGDGVCRKEEFSGQSGTVVNVRIMCDLIPASVVFAPQKAAVNLEYFQSRVIKNVNSRWLAPSRRLTEGDPFLPHLFLPSRSQLTG